jgi:hypothetical protein
MPSWKNQKIEGYGNFSRWPPPPLWKSLKCCKPADFITQFGWILVYRLNRCLAEENTQAGSTTVSRLSALPSSWLVDKLLLAYKSQKQHKFQRQIAKVFIRIWVIIAQTQQLSRRLKANKVSLCLMWALWWTAAVLPISQSLQIGLVPNEQASQSVAILVWLSAHLLQNVYSIW